MKILVISDTHGRLRTKDFDKIEKLWKDCEYCFLLGDIDYRELGDLCTIIPKDKMYGVLGNHDCKNLYSDHGVCNLHGKTIALNGVIFTGWGGTYRYKSDISLGFTQDESVAFERNLTYTDVLISHDGCFNAHIGNECHRGLKGISNYIKRTHPTHHIRGHLHEEYEKTHGLFPKTKEICVYRYKVVEV